MQIDIRTEGFELTSALHDHARRRLDFALARYRPKLERVYIRITDDKGPRGGLDKRCHVRVRLPGLPQVIINEISDDLYVAIDRAADRAGRAVAGRLMRHESTLHSPQSMSS